MKSVQGFVSIAHYADNTSGQDSPFGELSTKSRTFTKDKEIGKYRDNDSPGYFLSTFAVGDETSSTSIQLSAAQVKLILDTVRSAVAYATSHARPYDLEEFKLAVQSTYVLKIMDIDFGALVYGHNIELPEYITFTTNGTDAMSVKIWLSDAAFQAQYTGGFIVVVPPVPNLDDLIKPYAEAAIIVDQQTVSSLIDRVQVAKGGNPDSVTRVLTFQMKNRYSSSVSKPTNWGYLVYGLENDFIDAIKDATVDHISKNSVYGLEVWEAIFPELFQRTEMIVLPRWDRIATQNLTENASLFSPTVGLIDASAFLEKYLGFYGLDHIRNNSYLTHFAFRGVTGTITNGVKNESSKADWLTLYPDYMAFSVASEEAGYMSVATQAWAFFIQELLKTAEVVTPISPLPTGTRRVYRDNKLFVVASHDNVNYLVMAKWNLS